MVHLKMAFWSRWQLSAALNGVDTVVFDKTGTLTKGVFSVTSITALHGYSEVDVLRLAALAEMHSEPTPSRFPSNART